MTAQATGKKKSKIRWCKCGHRDQEHFIEHRLPPEAFARMDFEADALRRRLGMDAQAQPSPETLAQYNAAVIDIIRRAETDFDEKRWRYVGGCRKPCSCPGFDDAGDVGNLALRLERIEQRLDRLEREKVS